MTPCGGVENNIVCKGSLAPYTKTQTSPVSFYVSLTSATNTHTQYKNIVFKTLQISKHLNPRMSAICDSHLSCVRSHVSHVYIQNPFYIIQYTEYSIQHTAYSIHYTLYIIQYTVYSIQLTVYSIQYTVYSLQKQYTVYSKQYTLCSKQ